MAGPGKRRRKPAPKAKAGARPAGRPEAVAEAGEPVRSGGSAPSRPKPSSARRGQAAVRQRSVGILLVLLVAGVVVAAVINSRSGDDKSQRLQGVLTAGSCQVDTRSDPGSEHVARPTYKVDPPSGGDHEAVASQPGIYKPGQVPPDGQLVHAMEHGFVILWYRPDVEVVDKLEALGDEYGNATLVVPRPSLEVPVAATAWHQRLLCREYEERPLRAFIDAYTDKGPEKGFVEE